jgi:ABC-type phosphate transport system permease subunit
MSFIAPLALIAMGLCALVCGVISAMKIDTICLFYAVAAFGLAAGLLQWQFRRRAPPQDGTKRNTLPVQLYGMFILIAVCSVPGILIGRAFAGTNIWSGH